MKKKQEMKKRKKNKNGGKCTQRKENKKKKNNKRVQDFQEEDLKVSKDILREGSPVDSLSAAPSPAPSEGSFQTSAIRR